MNVLGPKLCNPRPRLGLVLAPQRDMLGQQNNCLGSQVNEHVDTSEYLETTALVIIGFTIHVNSV